MEMESQSLLDDSLIPGSQPVDAGNATSYHGTDSSFCPASQSTPHPVLAPQLPIRFVAASDDSDTDYEAETEPSPPVLSSLRRLKDSLIDDDEDGSSPGDARAVVNATLEDGSETDMSDAEEADVPWPGRSPVVGGGVSVTLKSQVKSRACSPTRLRETKRVSGDTRSAGVDLEAETQLINSDARPAGVDLETETQLTDSDARPAGVDLEAETRLISSDTHSAGFDLEAETQLTDSDVRPAGVDLEAETQLIHSEARSASVDLEAETQLTNSEARSENVDLEAETQLNDVAISVSVDLEAETQLGEIETDNRHVDLEAETQLLVTGEETITGSRLGGAMPSGRPPNRRGHSSAANRLDIATRSDLKKSGAQSAIELMKPPQRPNLGVGPSGTAESFKKPRYLNTSHVDLEAATQVFDPSDERGENVADLEGATQAYPFKEASDSEKCDVDLGAATQVYPTRRRESSNASGACPKYVSLGGGSEGNHRHNTSSDVDLEAATQVFEDTRTSLSISNVDLDAATQVYNLDVSDIDLDAATQVYRADSSGLNESNVDLDAATQAYNPRSTVVQEVDLEADTEVFKVDGERRSNTSQVDLETATQRLAPGVGSSTSGLAANEFLKPAAQPFPAGREKNRESPEVDLQAETELCATSKCDSPAGIDDLDMEAATQVYRPSDRGRTSLADVGCEAATQVLPPPGAAAAARVEGTAAGTCRSGDAPASAVDGSSQSVGSMLPAYAESGSDSEADGMEGLTQSLEAADSPPPPRPSGGGADDDGSDTDMSDVGGGPPLAASAVAASDSETDCDEELAELAERELRRHSSTAPSVQPSTSQQPAVGAAEPPPSTQGDETNRQTDEKKPLSVENTARGSSGDSIRPTSQTVGNRTTEDGSKKNRPTQDRPLAESETVTPDSGYGRRLSKKPFSPAASQLCAPSVDPEAGAHDALIQPASIAGKPVDEDLIATQLIPPQRTAASEPADEDMVETQLISVRVRDGASSPPERQLSDAAADPEDLIATQLIPPRRTAASEPADEEDLIATQVIPTRRTAASDSTDEDLIATQLMPPRSKAASDPADEDMVETQLISARPQDSASSPPERQLSDAAADPEDLIATQLIPTRPSTPPPQTPPPAALPAADGGSPSGDLFTTPRRTCSSLSTESEAPGDRIDLPSSVEVIQVLQRVNSRLMQSPPDLEVQLGADSESPPGSLPLLEPQLEAGLAGPASGARRSARRLFENDSSEAETTENLPESDTEPPAAHKATSSPASLAGRTERRGRGDSQAGSGDGDGDHGAGCDGPARRTAQPVGGVVEPDRSGRDGRGRAAAGKAAAGPSSVRRETDVMPPRKSRSAAVTVTPPVSIPQPRPGVSPAGGRGSRAAAQATTKTTGRGRGRGRPPRRNTGRTTAPAAPAPPAASDVSGETAEVAVVTEVAPVTVGRRTSSRRARAPDKFSPSKADSSSKRRRSRTAPTTDEGCAAASPSPSRKRRRAAPAVAEAAARALRSAPASSDSRRLVSVESEEDEDVGDPPEAVTIADSSPARSVASSVVSGRRGRRRVAGTAPAATRPQTRRSAAGQNAVRSRSRSRSGRQRAAASDSEDAFVADAASRGRGGGRRRMPADSSASDTTTSMAVRPDSPDIVISDVVSLSTGTRGRRRARPVERVSPAAAADPTAVKPAAASRGRRRAAVVVLSDCGSPAGRPGPEAPSVADSSGGGRPRRTARQTEEPTERPGRRSRRCRPPVDTGSAADDTRSLIAPSTVTVSSQSSARVTSVSGRGVAPTNHPRVLFTGFEKAAADERVVTSLGGVVVERPAECTVLVTTGVKRTIKFMACFARGIPIVTPAWLTKSKQAKCFLDPWEFLVRDKAVEAKFDFHLDLNLRKASRRSHPLLIGWSVHVTPLVKPPPDQLKEVIECAGGVFLTRPPRSAADRLVVISCLADSRHWSPVRRLGLPLVSAEMLLSGVLQQQIDIRRHALNVG